MKPTPKPAEPASPVTHSAEPLKNGATAMPVVAGPDAMPAAPGISGDGGPGRRRAR